MMESDWLDRLEKKLKRSPESAADAEEISENLDVRKFFLLINSKQEICFFSPSDFVSNIINAF